MSSKKVDVIPDVYKKIRTILIQKSVVIIGEYNEKTKKFINTIESLLLDEFGYFPVIIEKISDIKGETPRQKVHWLLAGSRFVIADDSSPSGETLELEYCRNVGTVVGIICLYGCNSSFMTIDFVIHSPDYKMFPYDCRGLKNTRKLLTRAIKWAETRIKKRDEDYRKIKKIRDRRLARRQKILGTH